MAKGEAGQLRIGFVASATAEIVPAIVLAFGKRYPQVDLELKNLTTVQQIEGLRNGSLHAGFVRLPLAESDLSVKLVHSEPFVLALPKDHRLARKAVVSLEHLHSEPFIAYGRR